MNWSKYSSLKSKGNVSFGKEKRIVKEAVSEVLDDNGNVVRKAEEKQEREFIILSTKSWDSATGEANPSSTSEYSLSSLEKEKANYDKQIEEAKKHSDGLKAAIADFKKV